MSTWYFLACDSHRARTDIIVGRSLGAGFWADNPDSLVAFVAAHSGCKPNPYLVSEHSDVFTDYEEIGGDGDTD